MRIPILIPAAGAARRMAGRDKLLEPVDGTALLRRQAETARATGQDVFVTLRPEDHRRRKALAGIDLRLVTVSDAAEGMAASIRAGIAALPPDSAGVVIHLADMPEIESGDLCALILAFDEDSGKPILRAASETGEPGHPVLFPADLFDALRRVRGDRGGRAVLAEAAARVRLVPLAGRRALIDLDTPAAWDAWRKTRGRPG